MKFKRNLLILSAILIGILIVAVGCTTPIIEEEEGDVPTNGTILIAGTAVTTNDTTPTLTLSSTGATHMAFSGNGITWSAWVAYATTYSAFNIATGEGCTSTDGTKIVYVKFKNDAGESTKVYDTIYLDTTAPTLSTAVYTDVDSSGTVNSGDKITFTFNDEMLTSTVTASTVKANLLLSSSKSYGTSPTVSWDSGLKICYVTLGASPTLVAGTTTVNPTASVKDTAGNADASTDVTITGTTTTILSSVSISPSTYPAIAGSSTTKTFTASALSTAATTMTTSCTFTWSISGAGGTISTTSGTTTVYTPAASAGTDTLTLSAVKTGTTTPIKTATATITVGTGTVAADPAKLFVSAQTGKAKYTALPAGATSVTVYSHATPDPVAAVTAGVKATIILNDVWTILSVPITANDHIYFMIAYSDGTTSSITADGQLPDAPDGPGAGTALDSIQATSKNTVTSSAASNVVATDNITLYISGVQKSNPAPLGSMTFVYDLAAGDAPTYTRTNANGHESAVSAADGVILILATAVDAQGGGGAATTLDIGDILTLDFGGNVDVNVPITVSNISWAATTAAALDNGTGILAATGTGLGTVVLTATATCTDFAAGETVAFNILPTTPIVDTTGGNQVLPIAAPFAFDETDF